MLTFQIQSGAPFFGTYCFAWPASRHTQYYPIISMSPFSHSVAFEVTRHESSSKTRRTTLEEKQVWQIVRLMMIRYQYIYKQAEYDQCVFSFPSCSTYSRGFCFCWPLPLPLFATYTLHAMSHQDLHLDESPNSVLRRLQLLESGAPGECGKLLETSLANSNIDQHHLILVWDEPWIHLDLH